MIAGEPEPRLAAPPRRVPLSLRIWLLFGGPGVVAWSWFVFGCALTIAVMRRAAFESWLLSILVFPLLGVVFIAVHWHETMRSLRLLENGRLARGRLVGQEDGGFVEDVGRLAKLRFRIEDAETHEVELTVTIPVPQRRPG